MDSAQGVMPFARPRLDPEVALARSRAFLAEMRGRRTVRMFSPEPVPRELIDNAIATAATAPSGANQQPWHFVVVGDPAIKRRLREAAEAEERENYERRFPPEWLSALAPLHTDWHKPHLEVAPWLIAVFRQDYGVDPATQARIKHYYVMESVGIAVGLLLASLQQAGLCTLTHTPHPMGFLNDLLGRPRNEKGYVVLPVGYPAPDCTVPVITKKSRAEVMSER